MLVIWCRGRREWTWLKGPGRATHFDVGDCHWLRCWSVSVACCTAATFPTACRTPNTEPKCARAYTRYRYWYAHVCWCVCGSVLVPLVASLTCSHDLTQPCGTMHAELETMRPALWSRTWYILLTMKLHSEAATIELSYINSPVVFFAHRGHIWINESILCLSSLTAHRAYMSSSDTKSDREMYFEFLDL